jgi:hypothetical protein
MKAKISAKRKIRPSITIAIGTCYGINNLFGFSIDISLRLKAAGFIFTEVLRLKNLIP